MMGDRARIEERMVARLIVLTKLGRHTPELHEAAAEEGRISRTPELLEEERRIELQGGEARSY